jgi:hypothetical protein
MQMVRRMKHVNVNEGPFWCCQSTSGFVKRPPLRYSAISQFRAPKRVWVRSDKEGEKGERRMVRHCSGVLFDLTMNSFLLLSMREESVHESKSSLP